MASFFYSLLRRAILGLARLLGSEITDSVTGRSLGRALLLVWRGRILVVGAECKLWRPVPLPQGKLVYWKQEMGFTEWRPALPERGEPALSLLKTSRWSQAAPRCLLVVVDHRSAGVTEAALRDRLGHGFGVDDVLLAYGGRAEEFEKIDWAQKLWIEDVRLRTVRHIREKQSYRGIFKAVSGWLEAERERSFTHVLFMESDHVLVAEDVAECFLREMAELDADVLGYQVRRMDGTLHPHWLGAVANTAISEEAWSFLGAGHFWKREAWQAVAACDDYAEWYLELDLPTTAVSLGFKVREVRGQEHFVVDMPGNLKLSREEAAKAGAWSLHPVKENKI